MAQSNQDDDYQAASRAMEDEPERTAKQRKARRKSRRRIPLILAVVVILVLLAGGAAYWFTKHRTSAKPVAKSSASGTQPTNQAPATPSSTTSTHYVSAEKSLNLEFDYPANWTVTPAATSSSASTQPIVVESVPAPVTDTSGTSVTGKVTITIRPGGALLSELASGNAPAAQDSVQIGYTHPTASQHQYPYLTFIHLTGGTNANAAFEEVMVTGIQQFPKASPVTSGSLGELDPIVSAGFFHCNGSDCSGKGAGTLSIVNATWQNTQIFQQTLALFESLKLN